MNNIILAVVVVAAAALWSRFGHRLPRFMRASGIARQRALAIAGWFVIGISAMFALGDAFGGRAQIARSPVRYATRLTGATAHHHDLADPVAFWRQVVLEAAVGCAVGGALVLLGRPRGVSSHAAA